MICQSSDCSNEIIRTTNRGPVPKWCSKTCANRESWRKVNGKEYEVGTCQECGKSLAGRRLGVIRCSIKCHNKYRNRQKECWGRDQRQSWQRHGPGVKCPICLVSLEGKRISSKTCGKSPCPYHKWMRDNPGRRNETSKKLRDTDPRRFRNESALRKRRLKKATPNWLSYEQKGLIQDHYEVARLLDLEVDHIIPLKGKTVCGLHVPWNLQLLTVQENRSKSNRLETNAE